MGDDSRYWKPPTLGDTPLWFSSVYRNKKPIELDYPGPRGREVLEGLVRKADVLLTNQLPRVRDKLGIDYDTIKAINPAIIYASITGIGTDNEREKWACYDLIAEGYSGVMDLTGEPDGPPQKVGTPAADLLSGTDAALECMAALIERERTGRRHYIDISLTESMTRYMTPRLYSYLGGGGLPRRSGARDSLIAICQVLDTADDPITLGLANDNVWRRFCEIAGRSEWIEDEAFRRNENRAQQRARLVAEIGTILVTRTAREWLDLFQAGGVPAGPINRLDQLAQDPVLHERGFIYAVDTKDGPLPQVGLGIRMDGAPSGIESLPPGLGEHSADVLCDELGLDEAVIENLKSENII
ncbi:MAG: CoA transferase [Mameliella sp.]|nr:CoA transferase [Mameliella sp.]